MRSHNYPKISKESDVAAEVSRRTGLPFNATYQTLKAFQDVIMECIDNEVEIRFCQLGAFTWKIKPPHKDVVYFDPHDGSPLPPKDVPGFRIPYFKISQSWKRDVRQRTEYWDD